MTTKQVPLLILSDAISGNTGLGRIARELAFRIHENLSDVFRVGVIGAGASYSRNVPFPQYQMVAASATGCNELPDAWNDFSSGEKGILFAIWNPSWVAWLSHWEKLQPSRLKDFLKTEPFKKWIYAPVDASTIRGRLHPGLVDILTKFDRVATYTPWAEYVIRNTLKKDQTIKGLTSLPHGISDKFRPGVGSRNTFRRKLDCSGNGDPEFWVGVVATNTPRKDWGLAFEVCYQLMKKHGKNVFLWAHTDALIKHWDIGALAREFDMTNRVFVTHAMNDEEMAEAYGAMDVTLGIGSGEGWGLPLAESLYCGTSVIHGNYAGGPYLVPNRMLVDPVGYYMDGVWMNARPVFDARDWAAKVIDSLISHEEVKTNIELRWSYIWKDWDKWLREGIA